METVTKSAEETKRLGKKLAADLGYRKKGATVLALTGELGSGKTTFVQGLAKGLGIKQRIISPTFILMRKYGLRFRIQDSGFKNFYHIDLYRFEEDIEKEVLNIGIEEIWSNSENIVAIEWAEKIADLIPEDATWIKFENLGANKRGISTEGEYQ